MPRLSLYRPEKGNDYKFIDRTNWEMFQVGGTDVLIHKYLGPGGANSPETATPTTPYYENPTETTIQDLLFLENRDRKYSQDVYILRGVYNVQDIDFNLSQFGLFLQNDTIFITFHINDTIEKLGRKLISGDVIELPHLKDEHALNDLQFAIKRFYVIEDVNRAAEGFSNTWYPHLYRAKCKPLVDSQEFKDILDKPADADNFIGAYESLAVYYPGDIILGPDGQRYTVLDNDLTKDGITGVSPPNTQYFEVSQSLRDIVSTYETEMSITQAVLDQAEADAPKSGYDTTTYYHLQKDDNGKPLLISADSATLDTSIQTQATDAEGNLLFDEEGNPIYLSPNAAAVLQTVEQQGYNHYLFGDAIPPNGAPFAAGIAFPLVPVEGQFHLRTDYLPNRLFRFNGQRWIKIEDDVRMTMNNLGESDVGPEGRFPGKDVRQTQKTGFINNTKSATINGKEVKEKQSLSKALRPQADE
jgi:hypothetical protein